MSDDGDCQYQSRVTARISNQHFITDHISDRRGGEGNPRDGTNFNPEVRSGNHVVCAPVQRPIFPRFASAPLRVTPRPMK
jgi:hypothetical protein